ncbi:MAG: hypothetical protein MRERC_5c028 [Mycoplasmataceae bacterium RC_NB112A]|nr:MAG: hypothetical protein MRERC_5c028 [Mycoplasmataceae bacterium RC_NB112A]
MLGKVNNLNHLTKKPSGVAKTIQEIEEEFLINTFPPGKSPNGICGGLSSEVIERIWW